MKKLIFAFIAIVCIGFSSAMAQNTNANPAITQFVTQHFPDATVQMVMPDDDDIDVVLNDYTKIEFRRNNKWKKVDCEHSTTFTAVPATLVPEQITAYVTANFPNTIIKKLEKNFRSWEIELNNGLELKFNSNFKVMEVDD